MSARDEILGRVRSALRDAPAAPPVSREYAAAPIEDPLSLFVERVEEYRATVSRCPDSDVDSAIMSALQAARAIVPRDLPWSVTGALVDSGQSPAELDEIDAVVTGAAVGIAVTGTVVLDHGPGQGRRALSLVPDLHVCVVGADQVVATVPEAVARLDPVRPQTWISGPSATSDIELNRVEGVHGPRRLHLILVEG
jgi:L-lactate dehydrogenase complex protein LldG